MEAPETRAVMAALTADRSEARFVGGCVRDAVARRPVGDIDIATKEPPERVIELLQAAGIRAIPTGIEHGTVTAVIGDRHFEITTLRIDVTTDGRRAKVAFTDDWTADAARRDFTINTLSCTPAGDIFDPFDGLPDLAHGRVRFVGNAAERIKEDGLRLLRFFRFYATYGRPPPDADALAACRTLAPMLDTLSGERVRDELLRTLMAPEPAEVINLMRGERVLERILPEAGDVGRLRALAWLETKAVRIASVAPEPIRRLAALVKTDKEGAERVAQRLRLSNQESERLVALAAPPADVTPEFDTRARRRALHRLGADAVRDLALLAWAGEVAITPHGPKGRNAAWVALLGEADAWRPLALPLKGRDALALGVPAGPRVGALLAEVEAWWEDGDFRAGRKECLARLKALVEATR
jgi:poly(A) polymerase